MKIIDIILKKSKLYMHPKVFFYKLYMILLFFSIPTLIFFMFESIAPTLSYMLHSQLLNVLKYYNDPFYILYYHSLNVCKYYSDTHLYTT